MTALIGFGLLSLGVFLGIVTAALMTMNREGRDKSRIDFLESKLIQIVYVKDAAMFATLTLGPNPLTLRCAPTVREVIDGTMEEPFETLHGEGKNG